MVVFQFLREAFQGCCSGQPRSAVLAIDTGEDAVGQSPSEAEGSSRGAASSADPAHSGHPPGQDKDACRAIEEFDRWPPPLARRELLESSLPVLQGYLEAVGLVAPEGVAKEQLVDWLSSPDAPPLSADLNDPDVIFSLCDTDDSNTLDAHQLRMALNSHGLHPDAKLTKEFLGGKASMNSAEFARLTEELLAPDASRACPKGLRTIPYASRGISLGQLKKVQSVFLDSGWLLERCQEFNEERKQEIQAGGARPLGENLYGLNEFLVSQVTTPTPKRPVPQHLKRLAGLADPRYCCAYAKLINPKGVEVDYFCSHYWGHPLSETMSALDLWARRTHKDIGKERPEVVTFWICVFALNQHIAGVEVGSSPEDGPFNAALVKARVGAVLILDENAQPFNRIWCLFEVHRLHERGKPLELISERGPIGRLCKEAAEDTHEEVLHYVMRIEEQLSRISAVRAQASDINDKHAIWHRIADAWLRRLPLSVMLSEGLFENPDAFLDFDSSVGGLLATSLLEASMQAGCSDSTLRYFGLGADFTQRHLDYLRGAGYDPCLVQVPVPDSSSTGGKGRAPLLHCAARFGHTEGLEALLERKADAEARDSLERTALHCAARAGRADIVKLLCSRGAKLGVTDQPHIWTPLHYAALAGHWKVVDLLVTRRADTEALTSGGWTPLFCASAYGNIEVVEALLANKACVNAKAHDGQSPLHWSAARGHREVCRMLIAGSASLDAEDGEGTTAIQRARQGGHSEVEALLGLGGLAYVACNAEGLMYSTPVFGTSSLRSRSKGRA